MIIKKSKERLVVEALDRIFGRPVKAIISDGIIIQWGEPVDEMPTTEQIEKVVDEIKKEEPMNLLRKERDLRLSQCDWRLAPDYPKEDQNIWIEFRKSLRDLPNKIKEGAFPYPTIDDLGNLEFSHWPPEPNS